MKTMKTYTCIQCGCPFESQKRYDRVVQYCSLICCGESKLGKPTWNKGVPMRAETKKIQRAQRIGKRFSPETEFKKGDNVGSKNAKWITDRSKVSTLRKHTDLRYKKWRKACCDRDGWKCQTPDVTCNKIIQVHHILRWSIWKDLRYETSNGITLCKKHHPIRPEDEDRLAPIFQEIINKKH